MTISEKILAEHCEKEEITSGDFIMANVDFAFGEDITFPLAIRVFNELGCKEVVNNKNIAVVIDHYFPAKDIYSAKNNQLIRQFAKKYSVLLFEGEGIEHVIFHENGLIVPGDLVIGADSHTTTYGALTAFATGVGSTDLAAVMATGKIWLRVPETIKIVLTGKPDKWIMGKDIILYLIGKIGVSGANYCSLEFSGRSLRYIPMDDRFTVSNMSIEAGAKAGIFEFDKITKEYIQKRAKRKYKVYKSDKDAQYKEIIEIDLSKLQPMVALPHSPGNVKAIDKIKETIPIDQVVLGSCTNGRYRDLQIAAKILEGQKIHPNVRFLVFPGSREVYLRALKEGVIETLIEAGAVIEFPTCGPCFGGHLGILAPGEIAISTTNRNFIGRMGSKDAKIILASPAVAAASAILGRLASPNEIWEG